MFPFNLVNDIKAIVRSTCSLGEGMSQLIELCAEQRPQWDWERFRVLDVERDLSCLLRWLESVLRAEPPRADAPVLWFGLFNPIRDGKPTADLAVRGFARHPELAGPITWEPSNWEAGSKVLAQIYALAHSTDEDGAWEELEEDDDDLELGNDAEYPLCLGYAGLVIRVIATELDPGLFLVEANKRELFFGFDSGEAFPLGTVTDQGLSVADG